jgi:hypothetical protein
VGRPLVRGTADGGVDMSCRFCGARTEVGMGAESPDFSGDEGCPKCGAPRAEKACPRCGLIYEKGQGKPQVAVTPSTDTEEMWRELSQHFFEPARHQAFLAHCLHAGALQYAAARYAEEEESADRNRASIAEVRRRQVRALAEATLLLPTGDAEAMPAKLPPSATAPQAAPLR